MTSAWKQMEADRALRDAALALVKRDIEFLKNDLSASSLGERAKVRFGEGASDIYNSALETAETNKGALAAIVAALVLWFMRTPLGNVLSDDDYDDEDGFDTLFDDEYED